MAALVYAWWVVSLPPFSAAATTAVVGSGIAAGIAGAARRPATREPRQVRGAGAWAGLAVVAAVWELAAYLQHPRVDHPTVSSLANATLGTSPARAVAFVLWLLAAAALSRR